MTTSFLPLFCYVPNKRLLEQNWIRKSRKICHYSWRSRPFLNQWFCVFRSIPHFRCRLRLDFQFALVSWCDSQLMCLYPFFSLPTLQNLIKLALFSNSSSLMLSIVRTPRNAFNGFSWLMVKFLSLVLLNEIKLRRFHRGHVLYIRLFLRANILRCIELESLQALIH